MTDAVALTSSDPEPPVSTVVRDCNGDLWRREPADPTPIEGRRRDWFPVEADGSFVNDDPETWTRVAGNQGPVEVVQVVTDSFPATAATERCDSCGRRGTRGFVSWGGQYDSQFCGYIPVTTLCKGRTACARRSRKVSRAN